MGSKWRKAKLALGLNSCLYIPQTSEETSSPSHAVASGRHSDAVSQQSSAISQADHRPPTTPTPSSSGLRLSRSGTKSSKKTCAICLAAMKAGQGHAIFTAECSHSFHFQCITSNVKHGNQICPVCRAKWREIPFQSPSSNLSNAPNPRLNTAGWPADDAWMTVLRRIPSPRTDSGRQIASLFHAPEPNTFDDDELLDSRTDINDRPITISNPARSSRIQAVEVSTYPEVSAVSRSTARDFTVLIHLKAPLTAARDNGIPASENPRTPVDLVTVLDVSGSMAGTKLALLKRAMGFVVQNLGPSDRLCVIAFSSTARRLFPLRRMTESGRQEALQAVNSLVSNGGTNIAEALRKGAKVLMDRTCKNPVGSIILLSDGQDTYTVTGPGGTNGRANYQSLLPESIYRNNEFTGQTIPVHAFGFGADHDALSMHSISENSGGTFSFIEAEGVIQDAFAQCIGGLLSVVVQELHVEIESVHPNSQLGSVKSGSYSTLMSTDFRAGSIRVGDLYAEEERDFLVSVTVPVEDSGSETTLLNIQCLFLDPITKEMVSQESAEVKIRRPEIAAEEAVSLEVDRQRNRIRAAEAMAEARTAAENGDLAGAVSILENCRRALSESASARNEDRLCSALCTELKEMQDRMANRRVYEESGRAYVLSGLSSHSWQRATARGDSTDSTTLLQSYQTPSMVDMVTRSQTMVFGNPNPNPPRPSLQPTQSFPARNRTR